MINNKYTYLIPFKKPITPYIILISSKPNHKKEKSLHIIRFFGKKELRFGSDFSNEIISKE